MFQELSIQKSDACSSPVSSDRNYPQLLKLVRSINLHKTLLTQAYEKWNEDAIHAVQLLEGLVSGLEKYVRAYNFINIGGEALKVLGLLFSLTEIVFLRSTNISQTCQNASKGLTGAGAIVTKGSQFMKDGHSKLSCKKARKEMDNLMENTRKIEKEKEEYFELLNEYESTLDKMSKQEWQKLSDCLKQQNLTNVQYELEKESLLPSTQKKVPPLASEMERLRLDENAMNGATCKFSIIPNITDEMRNNPILKRIFEIKSRSLPQINGENAVRAVTAAGKVYQGYNFLDTIGLMPGDGVTFRPNRCATGIASALLLVDGIFNMVNAYSNLEESNATADEMRRVAGELKDYTNRVRISLKSVYNWECLQDSEQQPSGSKIDKQK